MSTLPSALALDSGSLGGSVDEETPVLGVLEERVVEARIGGISRGHHRRQIVGYEDRKDAVKERPGSVETLNDVVGSLTVGEPHEHVATPHRHHDEGVHHATSIGVRIEQHSHATEVGLQLLTRFTVGDSHRVVAWLGELLGAESLQGATRNPHATSDEQVADLGDGEIVIDPLLDLLFVRGEQLPRRAVFTSPRGANYLAHASDELIGELLITTTSREAELLGSVDVALGGLAIDAGSLG